MMYARMGCDSRHLIKKQQFEEVYKHYFINLLRLMLDNIDKYS